DSNRVLNNGIWGSRDVSLADAGKKSHWDFLVRGIEETVPLALVSPPEGVHLISVVGDIGGFRHDDLLKSPKDGSFTNPQLNTNRGLDFAELAPMVVVRVGDGDDKKI